MDYAKHHKALVEYLKVKVEMRDWHGVSDAANDLRVLEAQAPVDEPPFTFMPPPPIMKH